MFWSAAASLDAVDPVQAKSDGEELLLPGLGITAPAVLIPGICGSVLHVRGKGEEGEGTRRWVVAEFADWGYHKLWGRYNPDSRTVDSLGNDEVLRCKDQPSTL